MHSKHKNKQKNTNKLPKSRSKLALEIIVFIKYCGGGKLLNTDGTVIVIAFRSEEWAQ